jgi:hypothetical protein
VLAPRVERALMTLAVHAQQLDDRMGRLEQRIDDVADAGERQPTHDDLLEVRVHAAKLAAELSRVTVALRADIEEAYKRAVRPTPEHARLLHFAEQVRDLAGTLDDKRLSA